jgi:hypothetical protein
MVEGPRSVPLADGFATGKGDAPKGYGPRRAPAVRRGRPAQPD